MAAAECPIRTPDQRVRVFVSSTLGELAEERRAVRAAVERLHLIPVMFELGARPHPPREVYRAYLRQSHVFLGIYHASYGWVAPGEAISGLADEFRLGAELPRLIYVKRADGPVDPRLAALIDGLARDGTTTYRRFTDAAELGPLVEEDLATLVSGGFLDRAQAPEPGRATAVPVPLTPTVGRDADVDRIAGLLRAGVRLLTVAGPGGVGKSRIVLAAAAAVRDDFAGDVVFVPLESVSDPAGVLRAVAEHVGVADIGTRPVLDALVDELARRRALLVVDNFEQVMAAAPALGELLGRAPRLAVLVTSRHALRLRGEREYRLPPLAVPDEPVPDEQVPAEQAGPTTPAEELFVQRARAANPDFRLTPANRPAVARLVRLLDGLPLAIELAAPRVRLLSPAALLHHLSERLDLLSAGATDLPPRQRTLRATLDWSFQLLEPAEQVLFTRLSVFAAGATLAAVEAVCADEAVPDVLGTLSSLAEKSLLTIDPGTGETPRVRMLETVRARAIELLADCGAADQIAARHAAWYAGVAEPADVLRHNDAPRHWPLLEAEAVNLRVASTWAVDHADGTLMVDLARRLWPWLWSSGRVGELREEVDRARAVADAAGLDDPVRGYLAYVDAYTHGLTGDFTGGLDAAERAVELLAEDHGPDPVLPAARLARGTLRLSLGRDGAVPDIDAALAGARASGNVWLLGYATSHRGLLAAMAGELTTARAAHEESLATAERMGHTVLEAQATGQLAIVDVLDDRPDSALARVRRQVELLRADPNLEGLANALDTAAALAVLRRRWDPAVRAATAAAALRTRIGLAAWPLIGEWHDATLAAATERAVSPDIDVRDPWRVVADVLDELKPPRRAGR